MIGWGSGSTIGHTTVALRIPHLMYKHPNGAISDLFVCESTVGGGIGYWPVNGIQCNPYHLWLKWVNDADINAVHLPLAKEYRQRFNATAAYEFFREVEGIDYGFENFIFGWIDTATKNYPCRPPYPSKQCATWDLWEVLLPLVDSFIGIDMLYGEAVNNRLGTKGLDFAGAVQEAKKR